MKYLCMVFYNEEERNALPDDQSQSLIDEAIDFDTQLRKSGHLVTAYPLDQVREARTVRVRAGEVSVTDGPYTEAKEHIGGFVLIEARDTNEAVQLAARIPPARLGGVEVRPIIENPKLEYWRSKRGK